MTALIVIAWALMGAGAALVIGMAIAPAFGFPQMEGSSAIFAVLIAAPLGAIGGAVAGLAVARKFAGDEDKLKKAAIGSWLAIALLVLAGPFSGGSGDHITGSGASFSYQIRLPAGASAPSNKADILVELRSDKETQRASMYDSLWLQKDGERDVIQGNIEFWRVTKDRTIALRIGDGSTYLFKLTMPARPKSSPGFWESWFPVDQIDEHKGQPPRAPRPDEIAEIRHFVSVRD